MLGDLEIFATYRWLLAIACTIYTLIVTWQSLRGWLAFFASGRPGRLAGRYTVSLLLRVRLRQFTWELAQIAGLTVVLMFLLQAHHWLE